MSTTTPLPGELETLAARPTDLVSRNYWFPLALMGFMTLVWAPIANRWNPATTVSWLFWAIGGPVAGIAISYWFDRQSTDLGVRPRQPWVYPLIGVGIAVGCFVSAMVATSAWVYPAILIVVGLGNMAFGLIDRYAQIAIVGAALCAIGAVAGMGALGVVPLSLAAGGFMLVAGFLQWFLP